jgi:thiol-disulfide isomerase/thioredoxin
MEICCDVDKLVHHGQIQTRYESYVPDPAVVARLRGVTEPTTIAVVFGLWCGDSRRIVPEVLKALTEANNGNLQLLAVTVPYDETHELPLSLSGLKVRRFPTIVFLRGKYETTDAIDPSRELCRFVEESLDAARLTCV